MPEPESTPIPWSRMTAAERRERRRQGLGTVVMTFSPPVPTCRSCGAPAFGSRSPEPSPEPSSEPSRVTLEGQHMSTDSPKLPDDPEAIRDARADATAAVRALLGGDGEGLAAILNGCTNHRELGHAAIGACASVMTVIPEPQREAILARWAADASRPTGDAV